METQVIWNNAEAGKKFFFLMELYAFAEEDYEDYRKAVRYARYIQKLDNISDKYHKDADVDSNQEEFPLQLRRFWNLMLEANTVYKNRSGKVFLKFIKNRSYENIREIMQKFLEMVA